MLPDILAPNLDVIFCGTAAGNRSAQLGHYYAGRGNTFWKTLVTVGLTPRLLAPEEDLMLLKYGIGVTDLAKSASGMDRDIPECAFIPERLFEIVSEYAPRAVAF
jgi:TDG/mug DNA glycosylase family protein